MGRNKSTWTSQYSQAQKDAVIRACVVDGMSRADAARAAAAGELEGVDKFAIAPNYVSVLVRRANAEHAPEKLADPTEAARAIETAQSRMLAWTLRSIDAWEANAKAGRTDWPEHQRLLRALKEHERASKPGPRGQTEQHDNPNTNTQQDAQNLIRGLIEAAAPRTNGTTTTVPSAHAPDADADGPPLSA